MITLLTKNNKCNHTQIYHLGHLTHSLYIVDAAEAASISPRSLAKQLNMGNAASLERKIKRELELEGK